MKDALWQLERGSARSHGALVAALHTRNPSDGMCDLSLAGAAVEGARLFCLDLNPSASASPDETGAREAELSGEFVRGADLVAAYGETADRPFAVQARWRILDAVRSAGVHVVLEFVVSVETSLLSGSPSLAVSSRLPAGECLLLTDPETAAFSPLAVSTSAATVFEPDGAAACLRIRLPGSRYDYVEMVHPADFRRSVSTSVLRQDNEIGIRHLLTAWRMEKGVIVRTRLRALFVDRQDDRAAAAAWAEFAAAAPPLSA